MRTRSLPEKIPFVKINGYSVDLGIKIDEALIKNCKLKKKPSLIDKIKDKKLRKDPMWYYVKNCTLSFLGGELEINPYGNTFFSRRWLVTEVGLFEENNRLLEISFLINGHPRRGADEIHEFDKLCDKYYGNLKGTKRYGVSDQEVMDEAMKYGFAKIHATWKINDSIIWTEIHPARLTGAIFWSKQES